MNTIMSNFGKIYTGLWPSLGHYWRNVTPVLPACWLCVLAKAKTSSSCVGVLATSGAGAVCAAFYLEAGYFENKRK